MRPRALNFCATAACNLRCDICFHHRFIEFQKSLGKDRTKSLTPEEWTFILEWYKANGTSSVTVTGGESLLAPEIVDAAYNVYGKSCIIISNGTQWIDPRWRTRVIMSLHYANAADQDKFCGVPGTFDKIIKNIRGDKRVVITMVLNHRNIDQIEAMVELTRALGLKIVFSGFTPGKRKQNQGPHPLTLTKKDCRIIYKKLTNAWENNKDIVLMTPEIIGLFVTRRHQKGCSIRGGPEGTGWVLSLGADGEPIDQCVMGENSDCLECECIIPMQTEALKWALLKGIFRLNLDIIIRAVAVLRDLYTFKEEMPIAA